MNCRSLINMSKKEPVTLGTTQKQVSDLVTPAIPMLSFFLRLDLLRRLLLLRIRLIIICRRIALLRSARHPFCPATQKANAKCEWPQDNQPDDRRGDFESSRKAWIICLGVSLQAAQPIHKYSMKLLDVHIHRHQQRPDCFSTRVRR